MRDVAFASEQKAHLSAEGAVESNRFKDPSSQSLEFIIRSRIDLNR